MQLFRPRALHHRHGTHSMHLPLLTHDTPLHLANRHLQNLATPPLLQDPNVTAKHTWSRPVYKPLPTAERTSSTWLHPEYPYWPPQRVNSLHHWGSLSWRGLKVDSNKVVDGWLQRFKNTNTNTLTNLPTHPGGALETCLTLLIFLILHYWWAVRLVQSAAQKQGCAQHCLMDWTGKACDSKPIFISGIYTKFSSRPRPSIAGLAKVLGHQYTPLHMAKKLTQRLVCLR